MVKCFGVTLMNKDIHYVMENQEEIQKKIKSEIKCIINDLDEELEPSLVFISVPYKQDYSQLTTNDIRISNFHEYNRELTVELMRKIASVKKNPENYSFDSYQNIIKDAIKINLKNWDSKLSMSSFIGCPVIVSDFLTFPVVHITHEGYTTVNNFIIDMDIASCESFLSFVINECLKSLDGFLKLKPTFYENAIIKEHHQDIFRVAARKFMMNIMSKENSVNQSIFDHCNTISAIKYERNEVHGKLVITDNIEKIDFILKFKNKMPISEYRAVRKFLEVTTDEMFLICDTIYIYGLGRPQNESLQNIVEINFKSTLSYSVIFNNKNLLDVVDGNPRLPNVSNRDKFYDGVKIVFGNIDDEKIVKLWKMIEEATLQKSGTMIIISKDAVNEAERLSNEYGKIEAVELTSKIIKGVTKIDGSILIDISGVCHAVGIIIDGKACKEEVISRGSRFNSAIRYTNDDKNKNKCLIVVISDDGMVDIVPKLRKRISKNMIESNIYELQQLSTMLNFDFNRYISTMNWFKDNKFYLTEENCTLVNDLKKSILKKFGETEVIYEDFTVDTELNENYFYNEVG